MDAGRLLREARRRAARSLRQLAVDAGTSHATLSAYEHGRVVPGTDTVERVLDAAGLTLEPALVRRIPDHDGRGEELVEVLALAEQFPARHRSAALPVFPRRSG